MRHRKSRLRLNQKPAHAKQLERNLVTSLLLYEAVRTTRKRAKVIQPIVDRLITNAKRQTAHVAIRGLNAFVTDKNASRKVMEVLKERYKTRPSGFTSMKAVGARKGDGAQLVDLTLMDAVVVSTRVPDSEETKNQKSQTKQKSQKKSSASSETSETSASSKNQ
jgi:large subunit ribosomal protein L17